MASVASFLSSPTIRLILPSGAAAGTPGEDKTYTIHRSLLTKHTALLSSLRSRDSYVLLPRGADEAAVEHALEFLYKGDYTVPEEAPASREDGWAGGSLLESEVPAAHLPRSPLVYAAMAGPIGVWGRPAPVFQKAENSSTYVSEYFPATSSLNGLGGDGGEGSAGKLLKLPNGLLPSPPLTPSCTSFPAYEPVLSPGSSQSAVSSKLVDVANVPSEPHHVVVLRAHLGVYRFAALPTVGFSSLAKHALHRMRVFYATIAVKDLPELTTAFANDVFSAAPCDVLQDVLVELSVARAGELVSRGEFKQVVKDGGEYIARVFAKLAVSL